MIPERLTQGLKGATIVFAIAFAAAEAKFAFSRPISETHYPRFGVDPPSPFNLASPRLGVTVRASSVNWRQRNHPAYALAGRAGTATEKWVSAAEDRAPWIEVEFDRPRHVFGAILVFAGAVEGPEPTMRNYTLECFAGSRALGSTVGRDNENPRPHIVLRCDGVTRVRVTFPTEPGDVARLYGFEIWGAS